MEGDIMDNEKGFTLVELLGVVILLSIIISLVVPNVLKSLDTGKQRTYDILKDNMKIAAENYVSECAMNETLYKVYVPNNDTTIGAIVDEYKTINTNLTTTLLCQANNITSCGNSVLVSIDSQIKIPFICSKVNDNTSLTALDFAYNGLLKSSISLDGKHHIIRSTDDKDVGNCLKVIINYDETKYKYSYTVDDSGCN